MSYIILEKDSKSEDKYNIRWTTCKDDIIRGGQIIYVLLCEYKRYIYVISKLYDYHTGYSTDYDTYSNVSENEIQDVFMHQYKTYKDEKDFDEGFAEILKAGGNKTNIFMDLKNVMDKFANWYEDEEYGGSKKLIKISTASVRLINGIEAANLSVYIIDKHKLCEKPLIDCRGYIKNEKEFVKRMIDKKVIENDKIYDIDDEKFVESVLECKNNVDIIVDPKNFDGYELTESYFYEKIHTRLYILFGAVLTCNKIYCCSLVAEAQGQSCIDNNLETTRYMLTSRLHSIKVVPVYDKLYDKYYLGNYFPCRYVKEDVYYERSPRRYHLINSKEEYTRLLSDPFPINKNHKTIPEIIPEWGIEKEHNEKIFEKAYVNLIQGEGHKNIVPYTMQIISEMEKGFLSKCNVKEVE